MKKQENPVSVSKSGKNLLLPIVLVVIALASVLTVAIVSKSTSQKHSIQEHLALGQQYLSELDYEQAIAAFQSVLAIDPKSADAYKGLLTAYCGLGDTAGIQDTLQSAAQHLDASEVETLRQFVAAYLESLAMTGPEEEAPEAPSEELAPLEDTLAEEVKNAQVGDIIKVGSFEQDGDESNGAEPIEWQVIADEDGKKLLLSKYILMPVGNIMYTEFPGDGVNYTWKECGIRTYLNGEFYESAFTDEERELIAETQIRSTWEDPCSLGAELVDLETYSYESLGTTFTHEVGKIVTTDRIFIPDFDEDFARYLKVERPNGFLTYGTDLLAKSTAASGLPTSPYEQYGYDEAKQVCSEDVNLDESLIGEEFSSYIMRNGCSTGVSVYSEYDENGWGIGLPTNIKTTAFYVVHPGWAGSSSPYYLTELTADVCGEDVGIRPMMWVDAE